MSSAICGFLDGEIALKLRLISGFSDRDFLRKKDFAEIGLDGYF